MIETAITRSAAPTRRKLLNWLGIALLAIVGVYLLSPITSPAHPEGFTASVASLGLHLWQDSLANFDLSQPLNVDFFGLSKLGWVLLIAGLTTSTGISTSAAMTILNWMAFIPFTAGTIFLVRRWTAAPLWAIVLILLLMPGISESFFFFNDNVIASALAVSALCALYLENRLAAGALCGLLMGAAVLTRTDTVLVGIAVPLIGFERAKSLRPTITMLAIAAITGTIVWVGTLAALHATIFDLFAVAGSAVRAWDRDTSKLAMVATFLYYLGVPGLLLAALGTTLVLFERAWLASARLLLTPVIVTVLLWGKLWEVRQLLPLTPFLASLATIGGMRLVQGAEVRWIVFARASLIGIIAASCLGMATGPRFADGPRVLTGRIWNIQKWREWQQQANRNVSLLRTLAQVPTGTTRVVIVDHWNEDRLTHLSLQESGFKISTIAPASCLSAADVFTRGNSRVIMFRMHHGYVPYWRSVAPERLRRFGLSCIQLTRPADIIFVSSGVRLARLFTEAKMNDERQDLGSSPLRTVHVSRSRLPVLLSAYRRDAQRAVDEGEITGSLNQANQTTAKRTGFGR